MLKTFCLQCNDVGDKSYQTNQSKLSNLFEFYTPIYPVYMCNEFYYFRRNVLIEFYSRPKLAVYLISQVSCQSSDLKK